MLTDLRPIHIINTEAMFMRNSATTQYFGEWYVVYVTPDVPACCCQIIPNKFRVLIKSRLNGNEIVIPKKCLLAYLPEFEIQVKNETKRRLDERRR